VWDASSYHMASHATVACSIKVECFENLQVFTGASILAEVMTDFPDSWVTQADYEEDPWRALQKNGAVFQGAV
jgi:actin-related protein